MFFNNEVLTAFTMQGAVVIPIITAIVQAFKLWVSDKYAPFISMLVGIGITFLFTHNGMADLSGTILTGLLFGLAASGLYSGLQHSAKIIKQQKLEKLEQKDKSTSRNDKRT
jgi:hypothetical protein